MRLIDADEFTKDLDKCLRYGYNTAMIDKYEVLHRLNNAPTIEAVSVGTLEQFKWERDIAIEQLNEIGKDLGSKMDDVITVVRCKDCKYVIPYESGGFNCLTCPNVDRDVDENWFCADGERRTEVEE